MTRDSRCHELPRKQKLDNGRLTTKMAETCFVKLPTLDDNLRKQPNVTDLLSYLHGHDIVETLPAKIQFYLVTSAFGLTWDSKRVRQLSATQRQRWKVTGFGLVSFCDRKLGFS